jgi:hypothetical protein
MMGVATRSSTLELSMGKNMEEELSRRPVEVEEREYVLG